MSSCHGRPRLAELPPVVAILQQETQPAAYGMVRPPGCNLEQASELLRGQLLVEDKSTGAS